MGFSEGAIYSNWDEVESAAIAIDAERTFVGIDFGYINDPHRNYQGDTRAQRPVFGFLEYSAGLQNYIWYSQNAQKKIILTAQPLL